MKSLVSPLCQKYDFNFKGCLDISKEVQWVSVGQTVANLQAVKVGGLKTKFCHLAGVKPQACGAGMSPRRFDIILKV